MSEDIKNDFGIREDKPADWFEPMYARSGSDGSGVPWANMKTHPSFSNWLARNNLNGTGKTALVIGCGMGDDAIELESKGFQVTAFDVSDTAIQYCKDRFPESNVNFVPADLLKEQTEWKRKFDFVLEIFTIQALPPKYEDVLIQNIAEFVVPDGNILVIAEVSNEERSFDKGPPWLLTAQHIDKFISCGLNVVERHIEKSSSDHDGNGILVTTFRTRPSSRRG
jgi:ubiquinone/menaquinone biosynthesis C-methylase UbiE